MSSDNSETGYNSAVERLREQGVVGRSGRLRELFDFLAERGAHAEPATQAAIAKAVFQQDQTDADDATVRVYIHRLRKKLDDHFAANPPGEEQLAVEIPSGIYALRPVGKAHAVQPQAVLGSARQRVLLAAAIILAGLAAFTAGYLLNGREGGANAIWDPVVASERPVLLVLGDYYMYGEIDPVRPDEGRLIRDFQINGSEDLLRMQEAEPERYGMGEDFGINYLPFSAAYGLSNVAPLLDAHGKTVNIIAASELEPDMLNYFDVVYVGLLSGLALLEDQTFAGSRFRLGESYDELIDGESGELYVSSEARSLASPAFYRDYAYLARYTAPSGAVVTIIASERDTGLRGLSPLVSGRDLPEDLAEIAGGSDSFEALVQVTGQQGADLNHRLILARPRE